MPAASAAKTQKTCNEECRLGRRARQERERRKTDLAEARADERERQRVHRARKRGASPGVDPPVSLAGLSPQVLVMIAEMEREVGPAQVALIEAGYLTRLVINPLSGEAMDLDISVSDLDHKSAWAWCERICH